MIRYTIGERRIVFSLANRTASVLRTALARDTRPCSAIALALGCGYADAMFARNAALFAIDLRDRANPNRE